MIWKNLLLELGADEHPPVGPPGTPLDISDFRGAPEAVRGPAGRLQALFAFVPEGLTKIESGEDAEDAFQRYVHEHRSLWGLDGATDPWSAGALKLESYETLTDPGGGIVQRVEYSQTWQGWPVLNGNVAAIFWDGRLSSITGPILAPDAPIADVHLTVSESEATVLATEAFSAQQPSAVTQAEIFALGLDLDRARLVYWVHLLPDADAPLSQLVDPHRVVIDAVDGKILLVERLTWEWGSEDGRFRVRSPRPGQEDPNDPNLVWREGHVTRRIFNGDTHIYPWLDELPIANGIPRSPVPVFSGRQLDWQGNTMGFHWHPNPANNDFGHHPIRTTWIFEQDHASYWAQRAVYMSDSNMRWWPPTDPAYRDSEVAVITSGIRSGAAAYWDGCPANWGNPWNRRGDAGQQPREQCVTLASGITGLGTIFHEIGHTVNFKYLLGNALGTACDRSGLSEAQAGVYALTAFLHEFGSNTAFTDYDASAGDLTPLAANGPVAVHDHDADRLCAPPAEQGWCGMTLYERGRSLMQAVWEAAHGRDCEGGPDCPNVFNDGHQKDRARWAVFYAMKNTGFTGIRTFVGHFLDYYFRTAGVRPWAVRWWIFNHHRLVGDAADYAQYYGGQQCG